MLIIASSDLSHYYPYDEAKRLDGICLDRLNALDPEGLAEDVQNQRTHACGAGPLITMMIAAENSAPTGAKCCTTPIRAM